jgi:hypothetical protein
MKRFPTPDLDELRFQRFKVMEQSLMYVSYANKWKLHRKIDCRAEGEDKKLV